MQVCQQILNFLIVKLPTIRWHVFPSQADDVTHAIIVGGQAAQGKIFILKYAFEPRAFFATRGVRFVATRALGIEDLSPGSLLRIQAKFSVRFAALNVTSIVE